ncbi:MAG: hypothetical protein KKC76_03510 [Proteobacteria bacterium]|nr:hypothetical protein [Pseudomonadota bacterium]MBU4295554.1 hypothetical protein [Pseudomonadota bacterium]MCG2747673.1 YdjY domain-containing protein [Desulfobulbaceae bacterium]
MKRKAMNYLVMLLLVLLCGVGNSFGQPALVAPPPPPPPVDETMAPPPPLKMISPGVYEMGGCRIVKKDNRVEFPAEVNMDKGLLEYVIVGNSGKVHESLLRTAISPYALQISLLLLGVEGTTNPLGTQGEARIPEGDRVRILVSWQDKGKEKKVPVEQWIAKGNKPVGTIPWVFTGSVVMDGVFMAQADKSIVALFHDPIALIDHQLVEGASDEIWHVDSASVPPAGTKVTVVIEKIS